MEPVFDKKTDVENIKAIIEYVKTDYRVRQGDTVKFSKGGMEINGVFNYNVTRLFMKALTHFLLDRDWAFLDLVMEQGSVHVTITEHASRKQVCFSIDVEGL